MEENLEPQSTRPPVPADIAEVRGFLAAIHSDLSDVMDEAIRDWLAELNDDIKRWRAGGSVPDWASLREWCNDICRDDGMPPLFVAPTDSQDEPAPKEGVAGGAAS